MLGRPRETVTVADMSVGADTLVAGLRFLGLGTDAAVPLGPDPTGVGLPCRPVDDTPFLALPAACLDGDILVVGESVSDLMTDNLQYIMFFENIKEIGGEFDPAQAEPWVCVPALGPTESCVGLGLDEFDGPVDQSVLVHFITGKDEDVFAVHVISLAYAFSCVKTGVAPLRRVRPLLPDVTGHFDYGCLVDSERSRLLPQQ